MYFVNRNSIKSYRGNKKFILTEKEIEDSPENMKLVAVINKDAIKAALAIESLKVGIFAVLSFTLLGFLNKFGILNIDKLIYAINY